MAANRYSAILDIALSGKSAREVTEILRKTEDIRDVLQSISKTPIALDDGRRANDTYKQLAKNVNDFARGIANGNRQLAATEVGLQRQASALSRVSAQAKIGGALYKNAIEGQVKAEQKLRIAQLDRLKTEQNLFARGKGAFNESFKGVPELIKLGPKVSNTTASLELYRDELSRTLSVVDISSNEFRALENAIAGVNKRLNEAGLTGQTSKIKAAAGPATDLASLSAFKQRETFQRNTTRELGRQLGVEERIANSQLSQVQKKELLKRLGEATNALAENDLTLARQLSTETDKYRQSLERNKKGGTTRAGEFSPLTAPKRATNIFKSTELAIEKINTLEAKGTDVTNLRAKAQELLGRFKNNEIDLSLKSLNLADDELLAIREQLKLENQILQTKAQQNKKDKQATAAAKKDKKLEFTKTRIGRATVGAAFPALFGGGVGSVAGGGIGEFALGPLGGVIGSAIGGALETAARQVAEFGNALRDPTKNLERLAQAAGLAGTAQSRNIAISQFLGAPEIGGTIAKQGVEQVIGEQGVKQLKELGAESQKLGNNFSKIGTRLQSAFAPLLNQLARFGTAITGGSQEPGRLRQVQQQLSQARALPVNTRGRSTRIETLAKEEAKLLEINKDSAENENNINSIIQGRQVLLEKATTLEKNRLTLRRDTLANEQASVQVNQLQNSLKEIQIRLDQGIVGEAEKKLQIEKAAVEEQIRAAKFARSNAVREAEIAIERDRISLSQQFERSKMNIFSTTVKLAELDFSDAETLGLKVAHAEEEFNLQKRLVVSKAKATLLTVNEEGKRKDIVRNAIQEVLGLQKKLELTKEQIRQNEILRKDGEQAFKDQRALNKLTQERQAQLEIAKLNPERSLQADAMGLGFFGDSVSLQFEQIREASVQTELYNEQLSRLKSRFEELKTVDPEASKGVQQQIFTLEDQIASYTRLQPAIDKARLAQQQFNDAFAFTAPVVTSVVNGLSEVIQGTQTATEAFANFLKTIGDMLVQEGTKMIATYIAIGIAKAFAGMGGGSSSTPDPFSANVASALPDTGSLADIAASTPLRANGGPVSGGQPYMVGERGPELFVPGQSGGVMRNEDMRSLMGRSPASGGAPSMNFSFETTSIGGTEYVSREQLESAMAVTRKQASNDGAKRGMSMTLDKMQNSPRTRSKIGLR